MTQTLVFIIASLEDDEILLKYKPHPWHAGIFKGTIPQQEAVPGAGGNTGMVCELLGRKKQKKKNEMLNLETGFLSETTSVTFSKQQCEIHTLDTAWRWERNFNLSSSHSFLSRCFLKTTQRQKYFTIMSVFRTRSLVYAVERQPSPFAFTLQSL